MHLPKISLLLCVLSCVPISLCLAQTTTPTKTSPATELNKLKTLWYGYENNLLLMKAALPDIRKEKDENKRNALISRYTVKLEETKNAVNRLILSQPDANQLRQYLNEHATKYQNVYKLAAVDQPTESQISMFNRLNTQTEQLYQNMRQTIEKVR